MAKIRVKKVTVHSAINKLMKKKQHLVLRTVYLSKYEAEQLSGLAFQKKTSVNDIIRQYVHEGLERKKLNTKMKVQAQRKNIFLN